jgi:curli biogenesis system outer membrane secretion channel CsgG
MRCRSLIAFGLVAAVTVPSIVVAQDTRPGIAVWVFENGGSYGLESEDYDAFEAGLQQMLITELAVNTDLRLVDRSRLNDLIAEQDLGVSGRVDAATAAQVGRIVGAKYVILGGFIDWYSDFRFDARIVEVETSEIINAQGVRGDREGMFDMVVELADKVTRGVDLEPLSKNILNERKDIKLSEEAVRLYTKGLFYAERGDNDRAIELFSQVTKDFPDYTPAHEALRQVGG